MLAFHLCGGLRGTWTRTTFGACALSAFALALLNPVVAALTPHWVTTSRGAALFARPHDPPLDFLNAHVKPGEPIFVYPSIPMYYFLSGARNPTRYSILMYGINTDAQFREAVRSLEESRPRYVIWDRSYPRWIKKWFPAYRALAAASLIVEPYLNEHYRTAGGSKDKVEILERIDSYPARVTGPFGRRGIDE